MSIEIHHLAAVCGNVKRTIWFYHHILGLNHIQKTSLFDGPKVCHFYWDKARKNFLTYYHCPGLPKRSIGGYGNESISFSIDNEGLDYWKKRLKDCNVAFRSTIEEADDCTALHLFDPDGLRIKLVFTPADNRTSFGNFRQHEGYAIKGIYGIELSSARIASVKDMFADLLKMQVTRRSFSSYRLFSETKIGSIIDLNPSLRVRLNGYGRIHHAAFKIDDWKQFRTLRRQIQQRQWATIKKHPNNNETFYFWDSSGMLFEIVVASSAFIDSAPRRFKYEAIPLK